MQTLETHQSHTHIDPEIATIERLRVVREASGVISPEHWQRVKDEETSLIAECLKGYINIPFDFTYERGAIRAADGEDFTQIAQNGVDYAYQQLSKDKRYEFKYKRALYNKIEADLALQLAGGELDAQTILIVEPYAEEQALLYGEDFVTSLGFQPDTKLALIRAIEKRDSGIRMYTRGVEQSSLETWNKVLGKVPPIATTTDMVGEHMLSNANALSLLDIIQDAYIREIGGEQKKGHHDVWKFLESQQELAHYFFEQLDELSQTNLYGQELKARTNRLRYDYWSALKMRFEAQQKGQEYMHNSDVASVMSSAGAVMESRREIPSGCGMSIVPVSELTSSQMAKELFSGNILRCVTCPHCKTTVDAKLDKSAGTIECLNNKCRAKVDSKGQRIDKRNAGPKEKDFGDLLIEFVFGNEQDKQAKKIAKKKQLALEKARKNQENFDIAT